MAIARQQLRLHLRLVPSAPRLPATRGECLGAARPCPHVTCRHHLWIENGGVSADGARAAAESCSLDVADRGSHSMEEVGPSMGLSRSRLQQIEVIAAPKLRMGLAEWRPEGRGELTKPRPGPPPRVAETQEREAPEPEREDPWIGVVHRALARRNRTDPEDSGITADEPSKGPDGLPV